MKGRHGGYSDDENNDTTTTKRSSHRHKHHHHQSNNNHNNDKFDNQKRPKVESAEDDDFEGKLQSLIFNLGEKITPSLDQALRDLSIVLCNNLTKHKKTIFNLLNQCIALLPERITIYTSLIGLLHAAIITFGQEFIDLCVSTLKDHLQQYKFELAQRYVQFLSDLVNVRLVSTQSILQLYENFIQTTCETDVLQVRTDFYISCVLVSLPFNGKMLSEKQSVELNRLLYMINKYVNKRSKIHVPILQVWTSIEPHPQEEYLDCLWNQIKRLNQDDWNESQIYRPYQTFNDTLFDSVDQQVVITHDLPNLFIPPHQDYTIYPLPKIVFRMFDYTDVPEQYVLPGAHSIERYLVEEEIANIIHTYHIERKDCAIHLTQIKTKNKIPLNYMIIEVIFGHLFMLPRAPHLELFYGSLLLELCKLQPSTLPPVLAQAVEMLFERLHSMKACCIERFAKWFAYHLSNFQFTWAWQDWIDCLEDNPESPKIKFIRETFQKCMRLSFHQRVIDFVPEPFYKIPYCVKDQSKEFFSETICKFILYPLKRNECVHSVVPNKPSPIFKYEESDRPIVGSDFAQIIIKKIKDRVTPEELLCELNKIPNAKDEQLILSSASTIMRTIGSSSSITTNNTIYNPLQIDLFVSSLLWVGSKSFTHSFAALAKYHQLFKILIETEEQQIQVLKSMFDVWSNHQQMMVMLVDKMIKTQIIECSSVTNWMFSREIAQDLTNFYIWEILSSTIDKMNRQVEKYYNELIDLSRQIHLTVTTIPVTSSSSILITNNNNTENNNHDQNENKTLIDDIVKQEEKMDEDDNEQVKIKEEQTSTNVSNTNKQLKRRLSSDDEGNNDDEMNENSKQTKINTIDIDKEQRYGIGEVKSELHEKYDIIEERYQHGCDQQKKLYLIIFQRFIMSLSDYLNECENKNIDHNTPWFKWIIERLQDIFLSYHEQVFQYVSTFESLIFTSDIDFCILEVFQQFCALRS
ncbi:unnamed protein product [Didymodactylos carnosus]|uniref:MIF4G domain-containing protein n=2 Tax=Didymodactylos carnosus TaxID=1234261 RepID=A0A8S2GTF3_9BILA|nr:unnamed protein product [Didymodactylos carnosus]CAF3558418.1 unnamed protein product [Didymodactylos carnosus]